MPHLSPQLVTSTLVGLLVYGWFWGRWFWHPLAREAARNAEELLPRAEGITAEEIQRYVPAQYRAMGPDWIFTKGRMLASRESRRSAYLDDNSTTKHEYSVYEGVYGYWDHGGRLRLILMKPTEYEHSVRHGRPFVILYRRANTLRHHRFTFSAVEPERG